MDSPTDRPLNQLDASLGWYDSRMGRPPSPYLLAVPDYVAGYAWELLGFVRDPTRCAPVNPLRWPGHDQSIRDQVTHQLNEELPADRFDRARRR